jgi:hypothetical protein
MTGARKYARLFETGQYGKLYIESSSHARGLTFHIWVGGEPRGKDSVEVFGIIGGNPGWTESYGWLHEGAWQEDMHKLVKQKESDKLALEIANDLALAKQVAQGADKMADLLSKY